MDILFQ